MNETKKNEAKEVQAVVVTAGQFVSKANEERENRIVSEIHMITAQTKQVVLMASIEIGRRLTEAKSLIKHGQWGNWLKERVDYSQRTAINFMRIYKEYGENGLAEKSQAIANLSYSHALALIDVPAEERAKFAEEKHAQDMKIKELQEQIKAMSAERDNKALQYQRMIESKNKEVEAAKKQTGELDAKIKELEKKASEEVQAEVKKCLETAIAKEKEALKQAKEQVGALQKSVVELNQKHTAEIAKAKEKAHADAAAEVKKHEAVLAKVRADMQAEIREAKAALDKSKITLKVEKDKNALAGNLAIADYAIIDLLDRYAQVMDFIMKIKELDKAKAEKLLVDLEKSLSTVRETAKLKMQTA